MNIKVYYWLVASLAFADFLNFTIGNLIGYYLYGFPIYYFGFLFNFVLFGVIIFLAWKKNILSILVFFLYSLYDYWSAYSWGVTGFTIQGQYIQPLLSVWLDLLSMLFCFFMGTYWVISSKNSLNQSKSRSE